jgi:tetratricopeptide (TPR) repeat protein
VTIRLETALEQKGIPRPGRWIEETVGGDLDRALAETVTLAAADVLLEDLLKLLDATPLARRLLLGASVYRPPVDEVALAWQVGEEVVPAPDPGWEAIRERVNERARELKDGGEVPSREILGLSAAEWQAYDEGLRRILTPPIRVPEGIPDAQRLLDRLGLLSPVPAGEATLYQVHRWTAAALAKESEPDALQKAHRRAARFWSWRVQQVPQSRQADVEQLLEARYHHHTASDVDQAVAVTEAVISQLDTLGAYGWVEQLCRDVLVWVPERSREAADFLHWLGIVDQKRGSYDDALEWYRRSLAINEELGNRAGMASSLSQIGVLLTETGRPDEAVPWNLRSLALRLEIGVPQVRIDLHWLGRQREALGEDRFGGVLREHLDEEGAGKVLRMLDELGREE